MSERQRLMLAVAIAAPPRVMLVGSLLALVDDDSALPLIDVLRSGGQEPTVISERSSEVAEAVDRILFVSGGTDDVDLSVVGIDESDMDGMLARLVTEHHSPGDLIYRQGSPTDRILFVTSGHVEITTSSDHGGTHRVAVLGPGNHCGDLRLTAGEARTENAFALDDCVVRSLSRQAVNAGHPRSARPAWRPSTPADSRPGGTVATSQSEERDGNRRRH